MNLTKAEAAQLGRRAAQPRKEAGELLAIFVPGRLVNPLNASAWGWQKRSRTAKKWKLAVANALFEDTYRGQGVVGVGVGYLLMVAEYTNHAKVPKRVRFLANVHNKFDGDGLQAALKPVRDALVECGVISGDADKDGHVFSYSQKIDRAHRGVEIRVSLL